MVRLCFPDSLHPLFFPLPGLLFFSLISGCPIRAFQADPPSPKQPPVYAAQLFCAALGERYIHCSCWRDFHVHFFFFSGFIRSIMDFRHLIQLPVFLSSPPFMSSSVKLPKRGLSEVTQSQNMAPYRSLLYSSLSPMTRKPTRLAARFPKSMCFSYCSPIPL